jgi:hypothetical protein
VERHNVATSVERNPDGSSKGIRMQEALSEVLGIDYDTSTCEQGHQVLTRVGEVSTSPGDSPIKFWYVAGHGPAFKAASTVDFDDIVVRSGDRVSLVYVTDTDEDGLFDREEYLYRTDATKADTDGDGLDDEDELRIGWSLGTASERVYSDPTRVDSDGDGLDDAAEKAAQSDPWNVDTDGDGLTDSGDIEPTSADGTNIPDQVTHPPYATVSNVTLNDQPKLTSVGLGGKVNLELDYTLEDSPGASVLLMVGLEGAGLVGCLYNGAPGGQVSGHGALTFSAPITSSAYKVLVEGAQGDVCESDAWTGTGAQIGFLAVK